MTARETWYFEHSQARLKARRERRLHEIKRRAKSLWFRLAIDVARCRR